ncbi:hypothetical protein BDQ17DRAFT_1436004 [Cyathus striatus]|nr:hypothetical protein BDQ17DRAFT_1436004 [Cyathus striatus]
MKLTYVIVLLGLTVAPSAFAQQSPTCYNAGITGASGCADFISIFCADVSLSQFNPGDNGARCFNTNGYRCDFTAYNSIDTAGPPDPNSCELVLNNIANACSQGGEGKVADSYRFTFSLDPNTGSCTTRTQPGS